MTTECHLRLLGCIFILRLYPLWMNSTNSTNSIQIVKFVYFKINSNNSFLWVVCHQVSISSISLLYLQCHLILFCTMLKCMCF